jgi:hypothetical protein
MANELQSIIHALQAGQKAFNITSSSAILPTDNVLDALTGDSEGTINMELIREDGFLFGRHKWGSQKFRVAK